jgi:ATP synthase F1 epsilon subunit
MKLIVMSPTSKIIYENVDKILLDSEAGQVEILPQHQKMVSALNIGSATVTIADKKIILAINGGVIKIENDEAEILTSEAISSQDIIEKDIEKALLLAQKKITPTTLPTELIRIEKEIKYQKLKQKMREQLGNG